MINGTGTIQINNPVRTSLFNTGKQLDINRFITRPPSQDYEEILWYIANNGADYQTESVESAASYLEDMHYHEGGLYAVIVDNEYLFILT